MKWARVPLEEVADVVSGFGFPRDCQGDQSASIPFFKVGDMNLPGNAREMRGWTNTISSETLRKLKAKTFPAGTVIFPKIGAAIATGKKRILTCEATFDNNVMGLIPQRSRVEPRFLYYWTLTFDFTRISNIGPVPSIRTTTVENLDFPWPSLSEQRRIVEILDQADALRKKRAEADAKAERILSALFIKMFGDPVTNPKGFRKEKLADLIKVKSGNFLPAKNMAEGGGYPVYGGNGINGYHSEYMFYKPTIVIGRVGAYCGVIHYSEPKCWVTDNALYVAEMSDDLKVKYLAAALQMANLNQYAGRAGQPLISGSRIYPVEILIPSEDDQERYVARSKAVEVYQVQKAAAQKNIETLFSVLLSRAFSGDLTAKWREAHMKELLAEMEEQERALNGERPDTQTQGLLFSN